ncbi:MAG TPA: copper ion binding protein [Nitrospiria bacterium]|nr:copper ion binding protein [Nitrospiria bacterium]
METRVMNVKGMTCQHCVKSVKEALSPMAGVKSVDVALEKGKVTVVFDPGVAGEAGFKKAIEEAGYEVAGA